MNKYELEVRKARSGELVSSEGPFGSIADITRGVPICSCGYDTALRGRNPRKHEVVFYATGDDGVRRELSSDPRVFLDDFVEHPSVYSCVHQC